MIQNLKERFGTKGSMGEGLDMPDVLAWFEKQGEQKPATWSEEDENRFTNLIFLIKCSKENDTTKEGFIKFINRLKSLK